MNDEILSLYNSIKEGKISNQDAVKLLKEMSPDHNGKAHFEEPDFILNKVDNPEPIIEQDELNKKATNYIKSLISSVIKVPENRIEIEAPMEVYGIDSIMVMQLTNELEKTFGSLSKTLFFEYQTIFELTGYFIEFHRERMIKLLGLEAKQEENIQKPSGRAELEETTKTYSKRRKQSRFASLQIEPKTIQNGSVISDVAIIGLSGRYSGANNIQEFWDNLKVGKDCITEVPKNRWNHDLYYDEDKSKLGKTYSKWGGFLDGVDEFDPMFFKISPREAEIMDPQERLFLQCSYEAMEDAGYTRDKLKRYNSKGMESNVGVYVGVMYEEYQLYGAQAQALGKPFAIGGNPSSIANRVSYFHNFHGPSMAVDTMCSSSLTAIHLACQSIQKNECDLALAGGVNVSIHPNKYLLLGQGKFVSSKGKCESFGVGGDGYVPGEGVGAVLLKPLDKAIADGDHIYGIIKGSSINHGGKTNGYTVPNPNAQASVIGQAFKDAGINPRTISYLEAHGTGTSLGDPIEITGLTKTFNEYTKDKQFCAIGSVKSNIGHCESAAGIAAVTKVLMQLKYEQLVPSLHSKELNPNINFDNTPFVVQQELKEWRRPVFEIDGRTQEYPRRAGISAFGAGGSNGHLIIEEYIPNIERPQLVIEDDNPAIIVLSAKNEDSLRVQSQQLLDAIKQQGFTDDNLLDIAYTLQLGREAMEERLGIIVVSIKELEDKLNEFLEGKEKVERLYKGQINKDKDMLQAFDEEEALLKRKYAELLDMWVKGLNFDWQKLYGGTKPHKISLPTYPFAKEHYWLPKVEAASYSNESASTAVQAFIHPLLHQNTSNLSEQRFSSTFTGQEFFISDNVVNGKKIFPEVAYLEMARAAIKQASADSGENEVGIRIKDIIWDSSISIEENPINMHIAIYPENGGNISYEVYGDYETVNGESILYNQGITMKSSITKIPTLDINEFQTQLSESTLASSQFYEVLRNMGIEYGLAQQEIEEIFIGQDKVLAKIVLPSGEYNTKDQFVLHPSIMNSALQASLGLMLKENQIASDSKGLNKHLMPMEVEELEVISGCTSTMWALVSYHKDCEVGDKFQKFDIDICDETGMVCVRMSGITVQMGNEQSVETSLGIASQPFVTSNVEENPEIMSFEEIWLEEALTDTSMMEVKTLVCFLSELENQKSVIEAVKLINPQTNVIFIAQGTEYNKQSKDRYTILHTDINSYREAFKSIREDYGEVDAKLYLWALEDRRFIKDYSSIVYIIQAIAYEKLKTKQLLLAGQFDNELDRCYLESWVGFERSIGLVLPNTKMTVIHFEGNGQVQSILISDWIAKFYSELKVEKSKSILYKNGKRHLSKIQPITLEVSKESLLRKGGAYVITGGFGGLGLVFARHLAKTQSSNLILIGRTPLDAKKQAKIKELEGLGSQVLYVQADVCNADSMKAGLTLAKEHFGGINGVIHAAGIQENENILLNKMEDFQKVIDPKISGTIVLDEVLKNETLDFVCYFSSSSAILGDFGSCDYSIANRFQMAYSRYRNHEQQAKTIAINWPLWKDGGMGFGDDKNTNMYLKSSGQSLLEAKEGIEIFEKILMQDKGQYLILNGKPTRVKRFLGLSKDQSLDLTSILQSSLGKGRRPEMKGLSLEKCVEWDLKEFISKLLKIPRNKVGVEENLSDFGFDSISLTEFAKVLSDHYKTEITPAVFFGYYTIKKLTEYFLQECSELIRDFYQQDIKEKTVSQTSSNEIISGGKLTKRRVKDKFRFTSSNAISNALEPIAIIGISGRFPEARNIDEMWSILSQGKEVVRNIYEERFTKNKSDNSKYKCGFIPGVSEFDPLFFEISPLEAESMDPRQRLLLQESWNALEDAGYGPAQISRSKIGMFVGAENGEYQQFVGFNAPITSNHNGIMAARLAYFLNLNGPNMSINTACSSGLVAVHQACISLNNGECDTAIAAGVNLMLTPQVFDAMAQAGMLSTDGRCYAFDKRANGMIPAEAVAVVVLKRLSQAKADGDPIHAVIKGSGINYDGKTNGITAPSGVSQKNLIKEIYEKYNVNPEEIEYIVTHGTGTILGDPIEINALNEAFKEHTNEQHYCAITSVKTNFGHSLAASGIVNLISLVQAIRHQMIPASLNFEHENSYINWKDSPFYVNTMNKPWPEKESKNRIGAISSFGMSGTNVHMVIESYDSKREGTPLDNAPCYLLTLSAKTQEALEAKVKDLIHVLEDESFQEQKLSEICYTLLEGRHHFKYRFAIVVLDKEDALYLLRQVGSKEKLPNMFQGIVPRDFTGQNVIQEYVKDMIEQSVNLLQDNKKYQETLYGLGELYCQGYEISWNQLYKNISQSKISLPTYPFARESYWATKESMILNMGATTAMPAFIHPLLHQNTSDLSEQRFSSTFTGQEFFLSDHVVNGKKVLPGVAYLEMAREAIMQATGSLEEEHLGIKLKNIIWASPISVEDEPVKVHIGIYPEDNGTISYEVYSDADEEEVYSQGSAIINKRTETSALNLKAIQAQCSQNIVTSEQCYEIFKATGIEYGLAHQGVVEIFVGQDQVLAKISLPSSVTNTIDQYVLHPSLVDSALQASIGLAVGQNMEASDSKELQKPSVPFALEELEVISSCTSTMWAIIKYSKGNAGGGKIQKLDIDLCDEAGRICVRIKGYTSRILDGEVSSLETEKTIDSIIFEPCFKEQSIDKNEIEMAYIEHTVILCEPDELREKWMKANMKNANCIALKSEESRIDQRFNTYAVQIFEEIQNIIKSKPKDRVLIQIVVPSQGEQQLFSGLSGMLKTAEIENPQILGQIIEVESEEDSEALIEKLMENKLNINDKYIRYQEGKRWVSSLKEAEGLQGEAKIPWKDQGVYLITGGVGGLGLIFAEEIVKKTSNVTLILTGRSSLNEVKQNKLRELESIGAKVEYRKADIAQKKDVDNLIQSIEEDYGTLNGIIHCAGIIKDNFILKKTKEEIQEVLAPKVSGVVNLDNASKNMNLNFFILFSSTSGIMGNSGQVDYSMANAFMDCYARYRTEMMLSNKRYGKTLSINWPLWKDGGMSVGEEAKKMMMQYIGMIPMNTETGINALYQGIAGKNHQIIVAEGNTKQIKEKLIIDISTTEAQSEKVSVISASNQQGPLIDLDSLLEKVQEALTKTMSIVLKVREADIDIYGELDEYGLDEIALNEFINRINMEYEIELNANIFLQYQTLESFAKYLIDEYKEIFPYKLKIESLEPTSSKVADSSQIPVIEQELLKEKATNYIKKIISSVIKVPEHRIEENAPMEVYGIDSMMVMQLTNELEKIFGSLSKTLFFEYQTIGELTEYFIETHRKKIINLLGIERQVGEKIQTLNETSVEVSKLEEPVKNYNKRRKHSRFSSINTTENEVVKPSGALDIAIIGLSGRYSGSNNVQDFWKNLKVGKDCITEIPKERWDYKLYYDEDKNKFGKTYSKWGGFLDDVDKFDPLFFKISPREAEGIDPQERLFLECSYEALEDAGYTKEKLSGYDGKGMEGNVGVYVGVMYEEYQLYGAQAQVLGQSFALGGNPSSIANRVSYFHNFHGPSMAIDTMCSSSLTAIHLACQSIQKSECELAIAGGVNVSIHPNKYLMLAQGKFASSNGKCQSFGIGGDGYVPGEGVGAVLLKPLDRAIADGDHIYGVIKGTAINHGGKTNGYTVPNPNAQASVIGRACKDAGINPRTISYLEAHGTGTSLGDPIEIAGLIKTFSEYTKEKQYCSIGSVKSNIGHCESAAGIAALTKVLMQFKYQQLVPSLHSKKLNPNIDFCNTPFTVQQKLEEWKRPMIEIDGITQEYPRRAGISAFGAGGSNGHLVIEEYIPNDLEASQATNNAENTTIILLSAKNENRLKEQVKRLLKAINEHNFTDDNLKDIAYTLQVGRDAMEERLGMIVASIKELKEKLNGFLEGKEGVEDLYHGQIKRSKNTLTDLATDEDMEKVISAWIDKGKYEKVVSLWTNGFAFDWSKMYGEVKPNRISLPTYPFEKESYWIPKGESMDFSGMIAATTMPSFIHPLLQENTSDFSEQRFSSTFTGQEFFLSDHIVNGKKVLPGVAYLEMARAGICQASGSLEVDQVIRLKNIVWTNPMNVEEQPIQAHIGLYLEDNGMISYEVYGDYETESGEAVTYSQGSAIISRKSELPRLDIKALQNKCNQNTVTATQCYEVFNAMGIKYGPAHQGIQNIFVGQNQVLAKLALPSSLDNTIDQYVMHPCLMDSALQASIGLFLGQNVIAYESETPSRPILPFAIEELEIISSCTATMWALVRYSKGSSAGDKLQKLDIDLVDEEGRICVRIKGYTSRVLGGEIISNKNINKSDMTAIKDVDTIMFEPSLKEQIIDRGVAEPVYYQNIVILCEPDELLEEDVRGQMKDIKCISLKSEDNNIAQRFQSYAIQVFDEIQRIIKEKPKDKVLIQLVVTSQGEKQLFSGISGLLKTAQIENPKLIGQLIEVELEENSEGLIDKLMENRRCPEDKYIKYEEGKRWVGCLKETEVSQEEVSIPWRDEGIYLITGGAGGLGFIFAREIASNAKNVTLILTGRSSFDQVNKGKLKELEDLGAIVEYKTADVVQKEDVDRLIQGIKEKYGTLNGIIHSAGVIKDNFILRKTKEEIQKVLAPKVWGVVNLDTASKSIKLDFFILFSSTSGVMGNAGQADYSTANSFMDSYARYRTEMVLEKKCYGKTLAINWPLWKDGGMNVNEETRKMMNGIGIESLETSKAINLLYKALASNRSQLMVMQGDLSKLKLLAGIDSKESTNIGKDDNKAFLEIVEKISKGELSNEQLVKELLREV